MFVNPKLGQIRDISAANTEFEETKGTPGSFYHLKSFGSPKGKRRAIGFQ